jgi:hypothetical protein
MFRRRRRTRSSGDIVEDGEEWIQDLVSLGQTTAIMEWDPGSCWKKASQHRLATKYKIEGQGSLCRGVGTARTLIFSISALNLLVNALLDLSLQYPRSRGLVEPSCFQDVGSVNPVIRPAAHDVNSRTEIEFVDGYLARRELVLRSFWKRQRVIR